MTYKSIVVTKRGGPETMQIVENDLRAPLAAEAQIRILAVPVCQDDVAVRVGNRPVLPKLPLVPGYSILGVVEAVGSSVTQVAVGDRVAALTQYGGYAERIYLTEDKLVRVPACLDPAEAVVLILNYLVAYQCLHRVARVKAGDTALLIGASGGVGTAFAQLGRLAGVKLYGLASPAKHAALTALGVTPIDYHEQDFVEVLKKAEPGGLDFVFNGMDDAYFGRGLAVLRRGGLLVHYGAPQSFWGLWGLVAKIIANNLLLTGRKIEGYGTHRLGVDLFREDWTELFKLLAAGRIKPVIAQTFPLLAAAQANALLESGGVTGNLVLLAPELMRPESLSAESRKGYEPQF